MAVSLEVLPAFDQHRSRYSHTDLGTPMDKLGDGIKELKGTVTIYEEQYQLTGYTRPTKEYKYREPWLHIHV